LEEKSMNAEEITGRLRLAKPHTLRVFSADREDADLVEVSSKRDRWKRCNVVLDAMAWLKIDLLNSKGKIIDTILQDDESEAVVDESLAGAPGDSDEERWLRLMINAQRLALENHAHMLSPLIDGYVKLADVFGARLAALEKHFDRTLDVAYQNAVLQAQVDAGPDMDSEVIKMMLDKVGKPKRTKKQLAAKSKTNGSVDGAAL
jgi:hypothetical protein